MKTRLLCFFAQKELKEAKNEHGKHYFDDYFGGNDRICNWKRMGKGNHEADAERTVEPDYGRNEAGV